MRRIAARSAAVAGEQLSIGRYVEVYGPFLAVEVVPGAMARGEVHARKPEHRALGSLQVVPDRLAVGAEEFVARYFHVHGAFVHEPQAGAIGSDGPDAVVKVPRTFVAEHDDVRV